MEMHMYSSRTPIVLHPICPHKHTSRLIYAYASMYLVCVSHVHNLMSVSTRTRLTFWETVSHGQLQTHPYKHAHNKLLLTGIALFSPLDGLSNDLLWRERISHDENK
ncbi:hypothetical protein, unlikely [Trypanosoma brucei gambiense DAL972]|uniref:Uncharacterized protein n=1 Tax=Trypanosoma brucei gambiense (strain MHOM/CI/86/DAL972) TaxID=679716 RepID=C9ZKH1_TRYB9|nr:hypothetical protein, unlikely [Trypanosoma brucei gambiense DAL972]CBH09937.1 hypothetical protein, unlikely [Trypanosoma brucei gambiense DAL972]|eukprot:XP_011772228.1 hypothetical protein, unlikely [Trypanosoma brucei gambiense DAL972]